MSDIVSNILDLRYTLRNDGIESSDDQPDPQDLATEAITELEAIVGHLREIVALIEQEEGVELRASGQNQSANARLLLSRTSIQATCRKAGLSPHCTR
jgi:hypothetical protein